MNAVIDNDILIKGACYGLLDDLITPVGGESPVGVLGAARFLVPKQIRKKELLGDPAAAVQRFELWLAGNEVLEPSASEGELAALLEASAQRMALPLDAGESQLLAIVVSRTLPSLATGDKRCIEAVERLLDVVDAISCVVGRIKCLEQLVLVAVCGTAAATRIRSAICGEPGIDKTLSICFGCKSPEVSEDSIKAGLDSYISDLRAKAARALSN